MPYDKASFLALAPKIDAAIEEFYGLGGPRSAAGREMLANAWITHDHRNDLQKAPQATYWAVTLLSRVILRDAEAGWLLVTDLASRELPPRALYSLAGELQHLIEIHGGPIVEQLETQAPTNPRLRYLLGGVWRDRRLEPYWLRVVALRGEPWAWDPDEPRARWQEGAG